MKPLKRLTIGEYRGLHDITFDEFRAFNLLVGANNRGKTSVLEALQLVAKPHSKIEFRNIAFQREKHHNYRTIANLPEAIRWLFHREVSKELQPIRLTVGTNAGEHSFTWELEEKEYRVVKRDTFHWEDAYGEMEDTIQLEQKIKVTKDEESYVEHTFEKEDLRESEEIEREQRLFVCRYVSPVDHKVMALSVRSLSRMIREGNVKQLVEALRMFDSNIHNVLTVPNEENRSVVYIDHAELGHAPIMAFGDGMRRVLYLALAIVEMEGDLLLIDEFETGVHTSLLVQMTEWLAELAEKYDVQIVATTHSLETVDAILEVYEQRLDDFLLYRLREQSTETRVQKLLGEQVQVIRQQFGQDVR